MALSMRILFIKPKHIGDSLVLTPTIVATKQAYPEAEIWVAVRRGCESILAGCPEIDRILTLPGVEKSDRGRGDLWRQMKVLLSLWSVKFDYVFELGDGHRARVFAMLSRAKRRYSVKPTTPLQGLEQWRFTGVSSFDWQTCHRVEKDFYSVAEFLPLPEPVPAMRFERKFARTWEAENELSDFCVVQIGTRQHFNRWNREGWREVCRHLLERFEKIVISCGPVDLETEEALWLQRGLGSRVVCTLGKVSWAEVAGLFYQAKLYVGLNTAAMHLAAACQCPVVALFGPSIEDHWYPWRVPYRIVTSEGYIPAKDSVERYAEVKRRSMDQIQARDVVAACDSLLNELRA
ncbi:glycosyltransferase family 9 protein [Methylacidiphilales bacterium]|nr:glycosyltransferase family 9 protein [Candidatus Methylacidiphilales bacterium]